MEPAPHLQQSRSDEASQPPHWVNPELIISFSNGQITLTLPSRKKVLRADPATLHLLSAICDVTGAEIETLRREFTAQSLEDALKLLTLEGILLERPSNSGLSQAWSDWGEATWFFHLMSSDTKFAVTYEEQLANVLQANRVPPPQRYKCLCDSANIYVDLPRPTHVKVDSFSGVLLKRRTCRNFTDGFLSLPDLSNLLFYTAGVLFENETRYFGRVLKKCAPSPGARHATEVYALVHSCADVPEGVYHYCVQHHRLNCISEHPIKPILRVALVDQEWFELASVAFFFTCVVARLMWKYKTPRIYRLAHLEAGHYCQNLLLTGTALKLGVFCTDALADSFVESVLGLDVSEEFVLYAAGVGTEALGGPYRREENELSPHLPANVTWDALGIDSIQ